MSSRREFLGGLATGALGAAHLMAPTVRAAGAAKPDAPKSKFKLKYAPHFGMFEAHAGKDLIDQIKFMADEGFSALEDNGMARHPVALQEQIGATLAQLNMTMGVFVVGLDKLTKQEFASGKPEHRQQFVASCEAAVEVAGRVNAKCMTVVPGFFERKLPMGVQMGNAIDVLRAGAELFERHDLTMVLEPLSDTPDLFLRTSGQAYEICRALDSPACKILFDMWHIQRNEGRLTHHLDLVWDEIAYFQMGDEPGRNEPGTGEINYGNLFDHIHGKMRAGGRDFVFGMEHGNSLKGREGERVVIDAYRAADAMIQS